MLYLVQENLYTEHNENKIYDALEKCNLEYKNFKLRYFIDEIELENININNVFVFGAVKAAHLSSKMKFNPGSFYNENHDFLVYGPKYGEHMLNHDSHIIKLSDPLPSTIKCDFFARPTGDNKILKGEIFNEHEWKIAVDFAFCNSPDKEALMQNTVQISSPKIIYQEYRFFVVKGKVITWSSYKIGNRIVYDNIVDEYIIDFAQKMVDIYQPADAFVIDICDTPEGLKIVELNCINCSGFYAIDLPKLLMSLEENFNIE